MIHEPKLPDYSNDALQANLGNWQKLVDKGMGPEKIIAMIASKYTLSDAQQEVIRDIKPTPALEPVDDFVAAMEAAEAQQ